jgi:hypothetical protein
LTTICMRWALLRTGLRISNITLTDAATATLLAAMQLLHRHCCFTQCKTSMVANAVMCACRTRRC